MFASLLMLALCGADILKDVLDVMQQNFTNTNFNDIRYAEFKNAMVQASFPDLPLLGVTNATWNGFITYALVNSSVDPWGRPAGWLEWNPQPMSSNNNIIPNATNITITEPCDYVSNVAYYVSMTSILNETTWVMQSNTTKILIASFNTLAVGSSFFHASGTGLGDIMDNVPIGQLALASYQESVVPLPPNDVVADLRNDSVFSETQNGSQVVANLSKTYLNVDLYSWHDTIAATLVTYQSNYYITFGCTVVLIMRLTLPGPMVDYLVPILAQVMGLNQNDINFIVEVYNPALNTSLNSANVVVNSLTEAALIKRGVGTLIKMGYAFLWQEQTFKGPWLVAPGANALGGMLIPYVNKLGDFLTGYPHPDYVTEAQNVYPGDNICRDKVAHAKWHEESANGLVDLLYLTDNVHRVILNNTLSLGKHFTASVENGCYKNWEPNIHDIVEVGLDGVLKCLRGQGLIQNGGLVCVGRLAFPNSSMENCLITNDCFDRSSAPMIACLQNDSICGSRVPQPNKAALNACLVPCTDQMCVLTCANRFSMFSPLGQAVIACQLPRFTDVLDDLQLTKYVNCVALKMDQTNPFWRALSASTLCGIPTTTSPALLISPLGWSVSLFIMFNYLF